MRQKKHQVSELPSECTTIIVGREMTADGSMIVARSEDWDAMEAKNYELYEDTKEGPKEFIALTVRSAVNCPKKHWGTAHWHPSTYRTTGEVLDSTPPAWA